MKLFFILSVFLVGCASMNGNHAYRIYDVGDMEDLLRDYYTNDLKKISPGLACGDFKMENDVGCFKLLVNKKEGKVVKLVYDDLANGTEKEIYKFEPAINFIFIEKIHKKKLENSMAFSEHKKVTLNKGQPSLRLVFFGKSAVVFYWKDGMFQKIWVSD